MNRAFLSIAGNLSADNCRHGLYQRTAAHQSHKPSSQSCFYWGRRGPEEWRRLISGSTSPPGVSCFTGLAQYRRAAWPNAGGQIGADQGADADNCRTGWDELKADQLRPLYACWYTRSVHTSTSIDLGWGGVAVGVGGWGGTCVSSAASPPGVFLLWFHPIANNVLFLAVRKRFT